MIVHDALLIIDERQSDYGHADVLFGADFVLITRSEHGPLDCWSIRNPGPHFVLQIPREVVLSALKKKNFEQNFHGNCGVMDWYGGAAGRDGTGSRGINGLEVVINVSSDTQHLQMRICGGLVDKEQIFSWALPPPDHRQFELSMSIPLVDILGLFESCPE